MGETLVIVWMVIIAPSGFVSIEQVPEAVCRQTQEAILSVIPRPKILCISSLSPPKGRVENQ
jgi:hypothetical protein